MKEETLVMRLQKFKSAKEYYEEFTVNKLENLDKEDKLL